MSVEVTRLGEFTARQLTEIQALDFTRLFKCSLRAHGQTVATAHEFELNYPRSYHKDAVFERFTKAPVSAGDTVNGSWAGPLAVPQLMAGFLALARAGAVISELPLRRVPFNVGLPVEGTAAISYWVGQALAQPLSAMGFTDGTALASAKAATVVVVTRELLRLMTPAADRQLRDVLTAGVRYATDAHFLSATAAVPGVAPAGIRNGIAAIAPSGATAAHAVADIANLVGQFTAANPDLSSAAFVLSPKNALILAGTGGFPDLRLRGPAFIHGIPALVNEAAGTAILLIDASAILVGEADQIELSETRNASVVMVDNPPNPDASATVFASLWQRGLRAIKAEREINWLVARAAAVKFVAPTNYA